MPDFVISSFGGQNTAVKDIKTLKPGISPDALNWVTSREKDSISLRRGYARLGTTEQTGAGKVTGIGVGVRYDGTQVLWYSHGRKVKYYDTVTTDAIEVSTNLLPSGADGEDVWMQSYQGLGGGFMFVGSPNSSVYKIPFANPGSYVDQLTNSFRWGVFHIGQSRAFAGQRNGTTAGNKDKTGLYLSYIDKDQLSDYTQTTAEVVGASGSQTYTGVLHFKSLTATMTIATPAVVTAVAHGMVATDSFTFSTTGVLPTGVTAGTTYYVIAAGLGADVFEFSATSGGSAVNTSGSQSGVHTINKITKKTCMYVAFAEASGETFVDDRNGALVGSLGGTGTINYATGAYSVTFFGVTAGAVTASYYTEDSTSAGILDFSGGYANGQAKNYRQDDGGGNLIAIYNINNIQYCLHLLKTWQVTTTLDDTSSTNLPYRLVGIPYPRAAWQTPEGIIFADLSRSTEPKFRRLQVLQGTTSETIEPLSISDALDLSIYGYDYCVAYRWGDYEIFCCQEKVNETANTFNSVTWIHNVISGAWDRLNYYASCLKEYNGTLIAGDSVTNNIYTLFSGFDEDGDVIENYWTSSDLNLGTENLKSCRRMVVNGLIQPDQSFEISLAYDGGAFSVIKTIEGDADYVDSSIDTYIGGPTIGSKVIGGGGSTTAHPYELDFPINSDRFVYVQVKIEALEVGYVSLNSITFKDIRDKGRKNIPSRTA